MKHRNTNDDFPYRVAYAAQCFIRRIQSRAFDSCFENNDGDYVVAALVRRAAKNPKLQAAIARDYNGGLFPQSWTETAAKLAHIPTRKLCAAAAEARAVARAAWAKQLADWDREKIQTAAAAPLPTGAGDMTADMFNGGDTPLFNRAWAGGAR